jgi:stalled ribosome rescue protein Dom34
MITHHAAVWLDHNEARIFHANATTFDETVVESPKAHTQLHRKSGPSNDGHRATENQNYYREVAQALTEAEDVLVLGPATAKLELIKYAHQHDPKLDAKIVGVETVDHPTDRQLVAYIRHYFKAADATHIHKA